MNIDAAVSSACERIPGLVRGALVMVPDGFLLGATRGASFLDLEPLIRSAARCLALREAPQIADHAPAPFVEYVFVIHDQLVVFQAGRSDPRLALLVVATADHNLGFVLGTSRLAIGQLEAAVDLAVWGL